MMIVGWVNFSFTFGLVTPLVSVETCVHIE